METKEIKTFLKIKSVIYFIYEEEHWAASGKQMCKNTFLFPSLERKQGILAYKITKEEYEKKKKIENEIPNANNLGWKSRFKLESFALRIEILVGIFICGLYFFLGEEIMGFDVSYDVWIITIYLSMILTYITLISIYRYILNQKEIELKELARRSQRFNFDLPFNQSSYMSGMFIYLISIPAQVYMVSGKEKDELSVAILFGVFLLFPMILSVYHVWRDIAYNKISLFDSNKEFIKSSKIKKNFAPILGFIVTFIIMLLVFIIIEFA